MISNREIVKKYNALLAAVRENDFYKIDLINRVNCYTCQDDHVTKTRDVDPGVTPMFHKCGTCGKDATSSFFIDVAPDQEPTQEWYRPTLKEVAKMKNQPNLLHHIFNGGLLVRPIKNN